MRHIVIDCDPGHDDALAIMTAFAHPDQMKILGITTVGGNQTLESVLLRRTFRWLPVRTALL